MSFHAHLRIVIWVFSPEKRALKGFLMAGLLQNLCSSHGFLASLPPGFFAEGNTGAGGEGTLG